MSPEVSPQLCPPPTGSPTLRRGQLQALQYQGGRMGISAVPGSGKTFTLELLISDLVIRRQVPAERIGIFTYMRSSRANLTRRINSRLAAHDISGRIDAFTLHSLSLKILQTFQGQLGLDSVSILEGYEQDRLMNRLTQSWLNANTSRWEHLLPQEGSSVKLSRSRASFARSFRAMCRTVIRTAKNYCLDPDRIPADSGVFLNWAVPIYRNYQRELERSGKLDYDDLGWKTVELLHHQPQVLEAVQGWYDYLFEDESQDSSPQQEQLLTLMSASHGNLVRVGDPNQSIMSTFTTAEPRFFRAFCQQNAPVTLEESSRSAPRILELANALVDWAHDHHPLPELRDALTLQHIQPAAFGNPPNQEAEITFARIPGPSDIEMDQVAEMALAALQSRPHSTMVVLTTTNDAGARALVALRNRKIPAIDLLRSNPTQREAIDRMRRVAEFMAQPAVPSRLAAAFEVAARTLNLPPQDIQAHQEWLVSVAPERLLFPTLGSVPPLPLSLTTEAKTQVMQVLQMMTGWLRAARDPWADVLRVIVQGIHRNSDDLFIGNYLVSQLERVLGEKPWAGWQAVADEMQPILETGLNNLPSEILSFSPVPGSVTVTTAHRAKGLEWDEVYLTGLSAYDYPVEREDHPIGLYFLDGVDMQAEALAELKKVAQPEVEKEGSATEQAFLDLAGEKLRLLYVGITRAKRRLTLTVATQNQFEKEQKSSTLFEILQSHAG